MATEISLLGTELALSCFQGNRIEVEFTVRDSTATPIDISAATFLIRAQFRTSYAATSTAINCTLANGKLVKTVPASGKFKLVLEAADTSYAGNSLIKFTAENPQTLDLYFDVEVDDTTGADTWGVQKPFYGVMTLYREITR